MSPNDVLLHSYFRNCLTIRKVKNGRKIKNFSFNWAFRLTDYLCINTTSFYFYFFKASANRTDRLAAIQDLLNEPQLKVKEVHQVRWMSVFLAVETVYKTLDSLITFFMEDKEAKSKGYSKKIIPVEKTLSK